MKGDDRYSDRVNFLPLGAFEDVVNERADLFYRNFKSDSVGNARYDLKNIFHSPHRLIQDPRQRDFFPLGAFVDMVDYRFDSVENARLSLKFNLSYCYGKSKGDQPTKLKFISKVSEKKLHLYGTEDQGGHFNALPIAIHGLCHNGLCFDRLIYQLDFWKIPLQAISWPGAGLSEGVSGIPMREMLVSDYLNSLEECIRGYRQDVILIGHSVGGLLAQKLAARMPERVKGLVLLASNPPVNLRQRKKTLPETSLADSIRDGLFFPRLLPEWRNNELFRQAKSTGNKTHGGVDSETFKKSIILDYEYAGSKFITDYARDGGHVDRESIHCPILEIEGEKDVNGTALCQPISDQIIEHELDDDRRMSLVKFYGKDESDGKTKIIPGAPHNMMMGSDVRKTATHIIGAIRSGFFPGMVSKEGRKMLKRIQESGKRPRRF